MLADAPGRLRMEVKSFIRKRRVTSLSGASSSQAGCRGFEPGCPLHFNVEVLADRRIQNGVCDNQQESWRGVLKEGK